MKKLCFISGIAALAASAPAQVYINEIFYNPPNTDAPNEYFELRGAANLSLAGYYLIGVEGDSGTSQGAIQNVFDLTSRSLGANGFLAAFQKGHTYTGLAGSATILVNSGNGAGWGTGAGSSLGHTGDGGQTDIENTSATWMLIHKGAGLTPVNGTDLDVGDNGLDALPSGWTIVDSIGVLDNAASGDRTYGLMNFRNSTSASLSSGNLKDISFTAGYVGRIGNSTGSAEFDWFAADTTGTTPNFTFSSSVSAAAFNGLNVADDMHLGEINSVPEPSTGALLIGGGLVLTGYVLRRRSTMKSR